MLLGGLGELCWDLWNSNVKVQNTQFEYSLYPSIFYKICQEELRGNSLIFYS